MDLQKTIEKLTAVEREVLPLLADENSYDGLLKKTKLQEVEVMRALQWMENKGILSLSEEIKKLIDLDVNGEKYLEKGLPEKKFLEALTKEMTITQIKEEAGLDKDEINICIGLLRKRAAIQVRKEKDLLITITDQGKKLIKKESLEEKFLKKKFPISIDSLEPEERFAYEELKKRKQLIKDVIKKIKSIELKELGKKIIKKGIKSQKVVERLTPFDLKSGSWKKKKYRSFDVSINVPAITGGKKHFTKQAVKYIKKIWLELGFKEMTGNIVQTSFWDLDSLFVPQDHPAREMQDTFYIKDPKKGTLPDNKLVNRVKKTHEDGWTTGSLGWQTKWDVEKAKENLLRTHTTVLSAQTISRLKKEDLPAKFFSVGKVFRNEALDWKHLFEFYQVEGIVIDPNASFRNLIGYLKEFFRKMGFPDARVRPGHFPYTEPSAEVEVFHPVRKEWIEMGGSGVFRPEVVKPLLGIECPVLAWGLGMGRTISEYWDINDIRELYKNDLRQMNQLKFFLK